MPGPEREVIDHIQQQTDEVVRLGAIGAGMVGGPNAVDGYLNASFFNLLGVVIHEQGTDGAVRLLAAGLETTEAYEEIGC